MLSARAKEIFLEAVTLPPEERPAFVIRSCAGDSSLKDEVEDLLNTHDEAGQFSDADVLDVVERGLDLQLAAELARDAFPQHEPLVGIDAQGSAVRARFLFVGELQLQHAPALAHPAG